MAHKTKTNMLSPHEATHESATKMAPSMLLAPLLHAHTPPLSDDIAHEPQTKLPSPCDVDRDSRTYMPSPCASDREASTNTPSPRDIAYAYFDEEAADESIEAIHVVPPSMSVTRNRKTTPQFDVTADDIESEPEISDEAESRQPLPKSVFSRKLPSKPAAFVPTTEGDWRGSLLAMLSDRGLVAARQSLQPPIPQGDEIAFF
jgi:hypothetical protein